MFMGMLPQDKAHESALLFRRPSWSGGETLPERPDPGKTRSGGPMGLLVIPQRWRQPNSSEMSSWGAIPSASAR